LQDGSPAKIIDSKLWELVATSDQPMTIVALVPEFESETPTTGKGIFHTYYRWQTTLVTIDNASNLAAFLTTVSVRYAPPLVHGFPELCEL
jgi:hypothetical protein